MTSQYAIHARWAPSQTETAPPDPLLSTLHRLRVLLSDVSAVRDRRARFDWEPSRLNSRYVPALVLAELILAGWSFEQRHGNVVVSGFLVDMARVFEDFVTVALREAFAAWGGRADLQWRGHLDTGRAVAVQPDFVWSVEGVPRVVVDAKYKAEKPSGFPNADLYQILAYCTVLGLREGHLVYAKGNEAEQTYDVVGSDVRIHAHALDLDVGAGELLGAVRGLARSFVSVASAGMDGASATIG